MAKDVRAIVTFGTLPGNIPCQLCFQPKGNFGTLIDPNGHRWLICADCINSLWEDKQSLNQPDEEPITDAEKELITKVVVENLQRMGLIHGE